MEETERKKWEAINAQLILLKGYAQNISEAIWNIWKIVDEKLDGRNEADNSQNDNKINGEQ